MSTGGAIGAAVLVGLYFLPYISAKLRRHRNAAAILVLNLFLGWTFVGWVAAMVWASTDNVCPRVRAPPARRKLEW